VSIPSTIDPVTGQSRLPSMTIPLRFVLLGLLSLFTGIGLLVARPDLLATYHYNQYIIAVTHLFVLGFIGSIVMGAMYQLVPVALETRLYSERLARWHFVAHVVGVAGMVVMFWTWNMKQVGHFGSVFAFGVGLFVFNLVRTLRTLARWNVIAFAIAAALGWLSLTVLAGLYLATAKCWDFSPFNPIAAMHAHAHLGGLGVFVMLIVGIGYKLIPMFVLSDLRSTRRAAWSLGLLNGGLAGLFIAILLQSQIKPAFAVVAVAGLALYGLEILAILRTRTRRVLDWGVRSFLPAIALLAPTSVLGLVLAWPRLPATALTTQLENVYGFLGLLGVVGLAILGMLYKIVPFLVWFHRYSGEIGRARVPSMAEMYSERMQVAGYWTYVSGLAVTGVATALGHELGVRGGSIMLGASLAVFALNMVKVLSHWIKPRIHPTAPARVLNPPAASGRLALS